MDFEWDDHKSAVNFDIHGISFEAVFSFDWSSSITAIDDRRNYGEARYVSFGFINKRLHACVYTDRDDARRVISLRKANKREERAYEEALKALNE